MKTDHAFPLPAQVSRHACRQSRAARLMLIISTLCSCWYQRHFCVFQSLLNKRSILTDTEYTSDGFLVPNVTDFTALDPEQIPVSAHYEDGWCGVPFLHDAWIQMANRSAWAKMPCCARLKMPQIEPKCTDDSLLNANSFVFSHSV